MLVCSRPLVLVLLLVVLFGRVFVNVLVLVFLLVFVFGVRPCNLVCSFSFFSCPCALVRALVLDRVRLESTAPHFMQPHVTLAYPQAEVRRDLQQLLTHAVQCSTYSPADKAKMLR